MTGALVGTRQLIRLALRRDRVILPIWIVLLSIVPAATVSSYDQFYPTAASRAGLVASAAANPSFALLYGPAFNLGTAGGFIAWRMGGFLALLTGLMAVFTLTRHTRAEEDSGRAELLASTVVGRYAPLTAAIAVTGGASVLIGLLQAVTLGSKVPAGGAAALGASIALAGLVFTGVAAVAVQLGEYSRTANGIGTAVLGVAFLLRGAGDSTADAHWLSWLSPLGWAQQIRPFAGERWWVLALPAATTLVLLAVAFTLLPRRDVGVGLIPPRLGRAEAAPSLQSPISLAWRLQRGPLFGWLAGLAIGGALFGTIAQGISGLVGDTPQAKEIFERLGGAHGMVDAFLATMVSLFAMLASLYGVQATLRMRAEETAIRLEPLLATRVGRLRWAGSHLVFAFLGSALLVLVGGVLLGLTNGLRGGDVADSVGNTFEAVAVQVPAAWVIIAVATLLFGALPKSATAAWGVAALALLISMFGPVVNAPQLVLDVSPFQHPPKVPGQALTAVPLVALLAVSAVVLGAALAGWRRRDVG
ncbi:ABC transporter permease [Amycolatopsis benzoatilytica]|uniref:ABC transporter permease n=1 Tax=Amycolatopsis benzoatilytica TaxID=346045 RepID=UPI00038161B7|nr:exporter of polyketide antibiotics [Amycolatopsis benzoatilytica]